MDVLNYVSKAEQTLDHMDPVTVAKLQAAAGLAYLEIRKHKLAAGKFIETGSEIMSNFSEVVSPQDVAVYGSLCALASFDPSERKVKVIENCNFRCLLDLLPEVRDMVKDFHGSRYAVSLEYLEKVKSNLLLDIHLNEHVEALYDHILEKAIMQENEMTALFAESKLQERIDTLLRASSSKHVKDDTPEAEGVEEATRFGLALAVEEELLWRLLGDESVYANSLCGDEKRINLVHTAIIALQANRPKESVDCMNHVAIMECDLSILERAAFFVSTLRATLCGKRSVLKFLMRGAEVASEAELTMLMRYRKKVLQEFDQSCISQIGVINKFLLPNAVGESSVFYLRL